MDDTILRRTWAEIDLDALAHNYHQAREKIGPAVKYLGVVKADAYGHGAVQISRKLEALGADYLAVSSLDEARELRHAGICAPLLVLGHTPPELTPQLIQYHITQTVSAQAKAEAYDDAAAKCGGRLKVHIKVDTGMSRLGFLVRGEHFDGGVEAIAASCALGHLEPEGIFTHFSVADEDDAASEDYTQEQFGLFMRVLEALARRGRTFEIRHCTNSGALARYPEMYLDMVRPGIALYGAGADRDRLCAAGKVADLCAHKLQRIGDHPAGNAQPHDAHLQAGDLHRLVPQHGHPKAVQQAGQLVQNILHNAAVAVIPDAQHLDAPGACVGNIHVGALLRVQAAAHADIADVGALRNDLLAHARGVAQQHGVGVPDAAHHLGIAGRYVPVQRHLFGVAV